MCDVHDEAGEETVGGVGASAGTRDGGGAADLDMGRLCGKHTRRVVRALRIVGFAAWHRTPIPGVWGEHIHAIAISDPDLAPAAQDQVWDYYVHRDGLADNAGRPGPAGRVPHLGAVPAHALIAAVQSPRLRRGASLA